MMTGLIGLRPSPRQEPQTGIWILQNRPRFVRKCSSLLSRWQSTRLCFLLIGEFGRQLVTKRFNLKRL